MHKIIYTKNNTVTQEFYLKDIHNKPAFGIIHTEERAFNIHMESVLKNAIIVIALVGLLAVIVINFVIDKLVLSELRFKIDRFRKIGTSDDLSVRLISTGPREIRELADAANSALDRIEHLNEEIVRMAHIDSLTKIPNRKYFDDQYEKIFKNCTRNQKMISVLMIDIDFYKKYNDTYGHIQGDECLRVVAKTLNNAINRPVDILVRYGGEEFVIVLPNTPEEGAVHIANKVHQGIKEAAIPHTASPISDILTVSIGIVSIVPDKEMSQTDLVNCADCALYQAKESGRNKTVVFKSK